MFTLLRVAWQADLCDAIFTFDWLKADVQAQQCFAFLLTNLVSTNNCFLLPSFKVLIPSLLPELPPPAGGEDNGDKNDSPSSSDANKKDDSATHANLDLVHAVVAKIVALVPTSIRVLRDVLNDYFPHKSQDVRVQVSMNTDTRF